MGKNIPRDVGTPSLKLSLKAEVATPLSVIHR